MSDFDSNPFADPEAASPFSDPSVRQVTQPVQQRPGGGLDEYNPFQDGSNTTTQSQQKVPEPSQQYAPPPPPQPAVLPPSADQPPPYSATSPGAINTEDLQRRQEELERKAAELQRKEQEMRNLEYGTRKNNFPPLPAKCCVQPCFYQDFSVDIPIEFQKIVKIVYYLWIAYSGLLFLNVIGCLAYFIGTMSSDGVSNKSGITFGLSILFFVLFTPCSFLCWYRPLYKAFRSDSSFNFFVFFFIFFFQFCVTIIQCLGIDGAGTCGYISAFEALSELDNKIPGVIMLLIAAMLTAFDVVVLLALFRVHRIYRSTGASFEKAQAEFAQGVMSNQTVQRTSGDIAGAAARGAVDQTLSGGSR